MAFKYKEYSNKYTKLFEEIKKKISFLSSRKIEIEHIGSTAVKGLGGKGIIDISIGIKNWREANEIVKILRKIGFRHFHEIEDSCLFVSTKKLCVEGDLHVHIGIIGTKRYDNARAFRNILRISPEDRKKYNTHKKEIFKKCKGDRKLYKKFKNIYFLDFLDSRFRGNDKLKL